MEIDKLPPTEYAARVGVHPSRITALKSKLNKELVGERGKWLVLCDEQNERLFSRTCKPPFKFRRFGVFRTFKDESYVLSFNIKKDFDNSTENIKELMSLCFEMCKKGGTIQSLSISQEKFKITINKK